MNNCDGVMSDRRERPETVLVTGGAGFIGSTLVAELLKRDYRVRVLDNLETGYIQYLDISNELLEFIYGDVEDMDTVLRAMHGVSVVFHIAAASKVAPSLKNPTMATFNVKANVVGTAHVLEAAVTAGTVKRFIYAASSTYYGNQAVPFVESAPFVSSSPYAASKYMGELLSLMYDDLYGMPVINLRIFMAYGPRQPRTGGYAVVTGRFMEQLINNAPLTIEGTGENFRDFVHVNDVVAGMLLAMRSDEHGVSVNIGSGITHSVKQVADMISSNQIHLPPRAHDLQGTLADISRAKAILGYEPGHNFREETLRMTNNPKQNYEDVFWIKTQVQERLATLFGGWESSTFHEQNAVLRKYIEEMGINSLNNSLHGWA